MGADLQGKIEKSQLWFGRVAQVGGTSICG
jgi:hypothetical protein